MPCAHWTTFAEAAKAADDILADVFGISLLTPAHKDDRNIATREGFDRALRVVVRELMLIAKPADQAALRHCLHALDVNWKGLTEDERDAAIGRAARALGGVPDVILEPVVAALAKSGMHVVTASKEATAARYDLPIRAAFDLVDEKVIQHAATSQALYVRDEYGKRSERASERAREVVATGLEQGLDKNAIGARLRDAMTALAVKRSESYWPMVASVFVARARTWGTLSGFEEAGIEEYEISATLDAVSCNACRLMDGRTFSVASATSRFREVAASDDPEAVTSLQPFLGVAENDGKQAVYFRQGDQRRAVAQVVESAVGRDDERGKFDKTMTRAGMEDAGVGSPPFHPHCRCLCVPTAQSLVQRPLADALPTAHVVHAPSASFVGADFYRSIVASGTEVEDGARAVEGEFNENAARVFRGAMPTVETLQATWGTEATSVALTSAYSSESSVWFEGEIRDLGGDAIGRITRTFTRHDDGTLEAHHDFYRIEDPSKQGNKTGEAMLRQAIQLYEKFGVNKVSVDTAWVGRYAWATFGYGWDAATAEDMGERLAHFLRVHGIEAERAEKIAADACDVSWNVAELDVDGIRIRVKSEGKELDCPVGKAFLLSAPGWSGEIILDPSHPTYQRAKKRLRL